MFDEYDNEDMGEDSLRENAMSDELDAPSERFIPGTEIEKPRVRLTGEDGNAFFIMGRVRGALRRSGAPSEVIEAFTKKATSGDYDNVLCTCFEFVEVE